LSVRAAQVRLLGMNITSLRPWLAVATLLLSALPAHALFKVVGPDGKVTYSDRAPPGDTRAVQVNRDGSIASSDVALPFALRQVIAKFPVVLYTASKCEACEMGRALLQRRGIPFSERTATTNEDKEVWEKVTGGQEAPVMKVGAQVLRGFTASAWEETLDVAGYSRQSQLPPNYKAAAAQPLVEPKAKPPVTAPEVTTTPAPIDPQSNPRGIRF
jgi:glutaredoxin